MDDPTPTPNRTGRTGVTIVVAAIVVVAVAVLVAILVTRDDTNDSSADTTTTTERATTTTTSTTSTTTTTTTTTTPPSALTSAVWPSADSVQRFGDPVDAARSFATDFAGFTAPVVGPFNAGDSRSGEVEVRPRADGPVTTVLVRQLAADTSWWVTGAVSGDIEVDQPQVLATVTSPLKLSGRARGFEGTWKVVLLADGTRTPLAQGVVTGRGDGVLGPFESELTFTRSGGWGDVLFTTDSAENGQVWQAAVLRVQFGG
ncbi:MAG: Gmad2 immunoglobulin-like domain-containing protein [Acidimicrobiales bacterium]